MGESVFNIFRAIACYFQFKLWKKSPRKQGRASKAIYLDLPSEGLHRYILTLLHQLNVQEEEYLIVLPLKLSLLSALYSARNWKPYERALLDDPKILFASRGHQTKWVNCSIDYFKETSATIYRVPVGPHPTFYDYSLPDPSKIQTVFWAGNLRDAYEFEFDEALWNMPNRAKIVNHLTANHPQVVKGRISREEFIQSLANHHFYLCLPGMFMPLCHTVYECLILGCIPILHKEYMKWMPEEFQDIITPFSWQHFKELSHLIERIESGAEDGTYEAVSKSLENYQKKQLGGDAIFEKMVKSAEVLICAEERSVQLYQDS